MNKELLKKAAAYAALDYIVPGEIVGVGTGTTVDYFIEALKTIKGKVEGAVASSIRTMEKLKAISIPIVDLNSVSHLPLYIDSADEINSAKQMIKGGGGALAREKIIASFSSQFICIADISKEVDLLGVFPVAIEVLSLARSAIAREVVKLGADPVYREGFVTDNGNSILDCYFYKILEPHSLEERLNNIPGIISNGIFASRRADIVLLGTDKGVIKR